MRKALRKPRSNGRFPDSRFAAGPDGSLSIPALRSAALTGIRQAWSTGSAAAAIGTSEPAATWTAITQGGRPIPARSKFSISALNRA